MSGSPAKWRRSRASTTGCGSCATSSWADSCHVGERTAVIGGGNVALDAARTAVRLGSGDVHIYYRRSREEMPVTEVEYDQTIVEGVAIDFLVSPTRIVSRELAGREASSA